eukprot:8722567-Ditylum_brightwellii.AAC.1
MPIGNSLVQMKPMLLISMMLVTTLKRVTSRRVKSMKNDTFVTVGVSGALDTNCSGNGKSKVEEGV